jgi:hypothetical protein
MATAGVVLIAVVLLDAFETIVLPRRVARRLRLTRLFYRSIWKPWKTLASLLPAAKRREGYLALFGPLSLLLLLTLWAAGLILGFALLQWLSDDVSRASFTTKLYLSATTFSTLGIGDIVPHTTLARVLTATEALVGFGFLAVVIGYLPVIYQSFSRREVSISLLDARAGSPPTAAELLRRHAYDHGMEALRLLLHEWEHWSADLLESHLSYPVLAYFRSQHNNQSWLAALTAVLDTSALSMAGLEGACQRQAELTFAMARHAVVDLAQVFGTPPSQPYADRLPPEQLSRLRSHLAEAGLRLGDGSIHEDKLAALRRMYEPYIYSLSRYLAITLPPWIAESPRKDNWQSSAWQQPAGTQSVQRNLFPKDDHF